MEKYRIKITECISGEILAEDIVIDGVKLVSKNTVLNDFILNKLLKHYVFEVEVYSVKSLHLQIEDEVEYLRLEKIYKLLITNMKSMINEVILGEALAIKKINSIADLVVSFFDKGNSIVKYLNSLKNKDVYTYTHSINVAIYSAFIAKALNLSNQKIKELVQGALLHDIGKIKISERILNKPSKLTQEEYSEIKRHTLYGIDILNSNNDIHSSIRSAVVMHHERIDGSGYPYGLTGKQISLYAKIISVADVYDAMTSERSYKTAISPFKVFEMFITEGMNLFDTSVLFAMLDNLPAYYIGMKVLMDDGQIGEIVYIPPKDILSPIIKIDGKFIDFSYCSISHIVSVA